MIKSINSALEKSFVEVVEMIQSAKQVAMQTVNAQLVELYWQDERKSYEKTAIGILLCASKDDEVVEYVS